MSDKPNEEICIDKVILTIELVEKVEGGYIMTHNGSNPVSVVNVRFSDNMRTALYKLETFVSSFCEAMRRWEYGEALHQTITELLEERDQVRAVYPMECKKGKVPKGMIGHVVLVNENGSLEVAFENGIYIRAFPRYFEKA